jgi:hypothetical protein
MTNTFRALDYRHAVTVSHAGGKLETTVKGTTSLNTWTRKARGKSRPSGVTVRVDHSQTFRFDNAVITNRETVV